MFILLLSLHGGSPLKEAGAEIQLGQEPGGRS